MAPGSFEPGAFLFLKTIYLYRRGGIHVKPKKKRLVARMKKLAEETTQATQPSEVATKTVTAKETEAKKEPKKKEWFKKSSK